MRSISKLTELLKLALNKLPQIAQIFHWLLGCADASGGIEDNKDIFSMPK